MCKVKNDSQKESIHAKIFAAMLLAMAWVPESVAQSGPADEPDRHTQNVVDYWTLERADAATPRSLVLDKNGFAHIRDGNSSVLEPYPGSASFETVHTGMQARFHSTNRGDESRPSISYVVNGEEVPVAPWPTVSEFPHQLRFRLRDADNNIRFVWVDVRETVGPAFNDRSVRRGGLRSAYRVGDSAEHNNNDWAFDVSDLPHEGRWTWQVIVLETSYRWTAFNPQGFNVDFPDGPDQAAQSANAWERGGAVQQATGQVLFELPDRTRAGHWVPWRCSATVAEDGATGRSVLITAAHCIYDDTTEQFARNVLFIPSQEEAAYFESLAEGAAPTRLCDQMPTGCWVPKFGVVDNAFALRNPPSSMAWNFGYYVVPDSGSYWASPFTPPRNSAALDEIHPGLPVSFDAPELNDGMTGNAWTSLIGTDHETPFNLSYCASGLASEKLWLRFRVLGLGCSLGLENPGAPFISELTEFDGAGVITSVNAFTYQDVDSYGQVTLLPGDDDNDASLVIGVGTRPATQAGEGPVVDSGFISLLPEISETEIAAPAGVARGPQLHNNTAECAFEAAKSMSFDAILQQDGQAGFIVPGDCRYVYSYGG